MRAQPPLTASSTACRRWLRSSRSSRRWGEPAMSYSQACARSLRHVLHGLAAEPRGAAHPARPSGHRRHVLSRQGEAQLLAAPAGAESPATSATPGTSQGHASRHDRQRGRRTKRCFGRWVRRGERLRLVPIEDCHCRCAGQTGWKWRMKESYTEGLAIYAGPESCGVHRQVLAEALTGESAGWVLSREKAIAVWGVDAVGKGGRPHREGRSALEALRRDHDDLVEEGA
jgi:hypothetical protein